MVEKRRLRLNDEEERIYQYDGSALGLVSYTPPWDTSYFIIPFTADGSYVTEEITDVGIGLKSNDDYVISILKNPVFSANGVSYDKELAVTQCHSNYEGFFRQKLSDSVSIENGETFAVCLKVKKGSLIYAARSKDPNAVGQ